MTAEINPPQDERGGSSFNVLKVNTAALELRESTSEDKAGTKTYKARLGSRPVP